MIRYEFVTRGGGPSRPALNKFMKQIKTEIAEARIKLPAETKKLAKLAGKWMAQRVRLKTRRKGATGELAIALEDSVRFRRSTKNNFTITVGSAALLPEYWAMINYGGYISSQFLFGFWSDNGGKSDASKRGGVGRGQFTLLRRGGMMMPRSPIKGFHYIAYAHVRMLAYVRNNFRILKRGK